MARIAGDNRSYTFHLVRTGDGDSLHQMTEYSFDLDSVTTIIGDVLGKPAGAMAWWGYRVGLKGVAELDLAHANQSDLELYANPDRLEFELKQRGVDPNKKTDAAGDRGSRAHTVLELLAEGDRPGAEHLIEVEAETDGTKYCLAVLRWWDDFVKEWEDKTFPQPNVWSERPVWSLRHGYCGTLDLAVYGFGHWELLDLKTHKPARGFTKPGLGPAYLSDLIQLRAYRTAFEEMGLGETWSNRVVIARENGTYLEDRRSVENELWLRVLDVYRLMRTVNEVNEEEL